MEDRKECKHTGMYRSAGLLPIKSNQGLDILTVLYCEGCGAVMSSVTKVGAVATPPAGMKLPGIVKI